jgi:hypothetical protein
MLVVVSFVVGCCVLLANDCVLAWLELFLFVGKQEKACFELVRVGWNMEKPKTCSFATGNDLGILGDCGENKNLLGVVPQHACPVSSPAYVSIF